MRSWAPIIAGLLLSALAGASTAAQTVSPKTAGPQSAGPQSAGPLGAAPLPQTPAQVDAWLDANHIVTTGWSIVGFDDQGVTMVDQTFRPPPGVTSIALPSRAELFRAAPGPQGAQYFSMAFMLNIDCQGRRRQIGGGLLFEQHGLRGRVATVNQIGTTWFALEDGNPADSYVLDLCRKAAAGR